MNSYHERELLIPFRSALLPQIFTDVVVVGTGVAGLRAAIEASEHQDVILLAKESVDLSNTSWAQGGIAAVMAAADSLRSHIQDTLEAGAGLCEPEAVRALVEEGPGEIRQLLKWGMRVDRGPGGEPELGLEGGHHFNRIMHTDGDATGVELARCLVERVRLQRRVRVFDRCFAIDILVDQRKGRRRAAGLLTWHPRHGLQIIWARATVLATGGSGQIFRETTNPKVATGDGVAMAWRAGAAVTDLEFMQFHPTTLYVAGAPRHLISEAVRGEGAKLVDRDGASIMPGLHELGDLAPRDVVSRAIVRHLAKSGESHVWLDARCMGSAGFARRFPGLARMLAGFGLDAGRDCIPVHPAAHYSIGGARTDLHGRTNVPGLYACGECAATGVHGANRLASNSLLEGLVFGRRVAQALQQDDLSPAQPVPLMHEVERPERGELDLADVRSSLRSAMWRNVGIERSSAKLSDMLEMFAFWGRYAFDSVFEEPVGWETQNMLTAARLMVLAALARHESRGTHNRLDRPALDPELAGHFVWAKGSEEFQWSALGLLASSQADGA
ncbi:MAG: L-aspartate oxidase [Planctomycetes bacterium]|nr:L-aspartate oxidase [Planctomycetota bacterium]